MGSGPRVRSLGGVYCKSNDTYIVINESAKKPNGTDQAASRSQILGIDTAWRLDVKVGTFSGFVTISQDRQRVGREKRIQGCVQ